MVCSTFAGRRHPWIPSTQEWHGAGSTWDQRRGRMTTRARHIFSFAPRTHMAWPDYSFRSSVTGPQPCVRQTKRRSKALTAGCMDTRGLTTVGYSIEYYVNRLPEAVSRRRGALFLRRPRWPRFPLCGNGLVGLSAGGVIADPCRLRSSQAMVSYAPVLHWRPGPPPVQRPTYTIGLPKALALHSSLSHDTTRMHLP